MPSQFKILPFEPWHCAGDFLPVEIYDQARWRENLIWSYHHGPTYTGFYDNFVVGFGGVRKYWKGVGEGWVMLNQKNPPEVSKVKLVLDIVRGIKKTIKEEIFNMDYWRVHAYCHHLTPKAANFIEALGFLLEGNLRRFNPDGSDCLSFSMIKELKL